MYQLVLVAPSSEVNVLDQETKRESPSGRVWQLPRVWFPKPMRQGKTRLRANVPALARSPTGIKASLSHNHKINKDCSLSLPLPPPLRSGKTSFPSRQMHAIASCACSERAGTHIDSACPQVVASAMLLAATQATFAQCHHPGASNSHRPCLDDSASPQPTRN